MQRRPDGMTIAQILATYSRPDPSGCRLWTRGVTGDGYGQFHCDGQYWLAHVAAYVVAYGPVPEGQLVRHTCDTPPCIESSHLLAGTQRDNIRDALDRGRWRIGERHPHAVLTEELVRDLRDQHRQGESYSALARSLGCHVDTVRQAVLGITWRHVA